MKSYPFIIHVNSSCNIVHIYIPHPTGVQISMGKSEKSSDISQQSSVIHSPALQRGKMIPSWSEQRTERVLAAALQLPVHCTKGV